MSPLEKYLIEKNITKTQFSLISKVCLCTVNKAVLGKKITQRIAKRIVRCTKKTLEMKDFGY